MTHFEINYIYLWKKLSKKKYVFPIPTILSYFFNKISSTLYYFRLCTYFWGHLLLYESFIKRCGPLRFLYDPQKVCFD